MTITNVVISWLLTVILGSLICGFFSGEFLLIIAFAIASAVLSLPTLVVMIILTRAEMPLLARQIIYGGLMLGTGFALLLIEESLFRYYYVLLVYFVIGSISMLIFQLSNPLKTGKRSNDDILDF